MAEVIEVDPDIDGALVVSGFPAGSVLNTSKLTFNGMLIPGPLDKKAVQPRATSNPKGGMGLGIPLDSTTEVGTGTAQ